MNPTPDARVLRYLGLVVLATWLLDLPAALASRGFLPGGMAQYLPFVGLGALCPALFAAYFQKREKRPLRELLTPGNAPAKSLPFLLGAPFVSGFALTLGLLVFAAFGAEVPRFFFLPAEKERFIALILFPLFEEIGWRGYALPRLLSTSGAWKSSLILGIWWSVWHTFMTVTTGATWQVHLLALPFFVSGSYVFTWFYRRTGGSMIAMILLHIGAHLDNSNLALPNLAPFAAHTLGFGLLALAIFAFERRHAADARAPSPP